MNIYGSIQGIINYSLSNNLISSQDIIYARNQIMSLLNLDEFVEVDVLTEDIHILLEEIADYACETNLIENILDEREILQAKIMNVFISKPSEIEKIFNKNYKLSPKKATKYFYEFSKTTNYIKTASIEKNISFKVDTSYGSIDITINLSKPEKDPKAIAKQKYIKSSNYPKCLLCLENEGYAGKIGHPARSNHRVITVNLANEEWALQYSPYLYYNEHCIVLSKEHRDMKIDKNTFANILLFVEKFPHYFLGSNADLPIVGGSILSHDHYQGGCYEFAMEKAEDDITFSIPFYKNINASTVKWPLSTIRLRSNNIDDLVSCATHILKKWRNYSDDSLNIVAFTNDTMHNTVTPIARKKNNLYELDIVLRNNLTTDEFPMGIFHPHSDVHHIKKENIGLIEVMGLAVLPPRLKDELLEVEDYILGLPNNINEYHLDWANYIKETYANEINKNNVSKLLQIEIGKKFVKALEDCGVFKQNELGKQGFKRFINTL